MLWPTMSDYQDAVQNPQVAFMDQGLRQGRPVTDLLGLPRPITGGFASVYQIDSSGTKWAVRCFLRCHQDTEKRYASIGNHLSQAGLPYTAAFQYLKQGVLVRGQWYPVLKMEWVDGESLNAYVEKNLFRADVLQDLDREFTKMVRDLRRASIAHGDLQHGNILVVNGKLRLVDYDGMFVPALSGLPSHEVGHPNYQHPARSEKDFGLYLDSFSTHVIHASLMALSVKPSLWSTAGGGDEQLLFSRRDYRDPSSSLTIRTMEDSGDAVLVSLASSVRSILACADISSVPLLADHRGHKAYGSVTGGRWPGVGEGTSRRLVAASSLVDQRGTVPSWLEDHLPPQVVEFDGSPLVDRAIIAGYVLCAVAMGRSAGAGFLPAVWAAWGWVAGTVALAGSIFVRFFRTPEFRRKWSLWTALRDAKRETKAAQKAILALEKEQQRKSEEEQRAVSLAAVKARNLREAEERERARIDVWLRENLSRLSDRVEALARQEAAQLKGAITSGAGRTGGKQGLLALGRNVSSTIKGYRQKREPLLKEEESARVEAGRRASAIRDKYGRRQDELLTRLQEAQEAIMDDRAETETKLAEESEYLASQESRAADLHQEIVRYGRITFANYLKRVAFLWRGAGHRESGSRRLQGP